MARSIVLSNGELCVALDGYGEVRDLFYPHVGLEDHVRGHYVHHVGVWVDGQISWLSRDSAWEIHITCEENALASNIVARHPRLQVELQFTDIVFSERPIFFRRVVISNHAAARDIRLYFGQQFEIYKSHGGDTAYYDPATNSVIHYKGRRVFLMGALIGEHHFQDYAIGLANFHGKEGAWRDAEDGALSKNPIEHGPVDSVIGMYESFKQGESKTCYYWIAAAHSVQEARDLNYYIVKKGPENLMESTRAHWATWVDERTPQMGGLSPTHGALFKRSLMYVKAHADQGGGIIASLDSDMLQYGLDTYSYVWPRDAAYAAIALCRAGYMATMKRFLEFARSAISSEGYFMHKYLPDGSLGSSWHPWVKDGHPQLPIQEDETALTILAMHEYFHTSRDLEFLEMQYAPLVEKAANFLLEYRDHNTSLPHPCYDLWEEKRGVSTFTAASVYGALVAAAELSDIVKRKDNARIYRAAAEEMQAAILRSLWDESSGTFIKMLNHVEDTAVADATIDASSAWGIFSFGVLPPEDPRLERAWEVSVRRLSHGIDAGGLARYEGDQYYRLERESAGNPWIITTLWYAEYLIARAKSDADLSRVREIFDWVVKHAAPSGVLPEQLHPKSGAPLSATPLAWSHAAYVSAVLKYLARSAEFDTR